MSTWRPSPQRRQRSGSSAVDTISQGTNGSQIRSTSALDNPVRSASSGQAAFASLIRPALHTGASSSAWADVAAATVAAAFMFGPAAALGVGAGKEVKHVEMLLAERERAKQ